MANRKPFVYNTAVSTTTTSSWFVTDYRFDENPERSYAGVQAAGGTVLIQVAVSVEATPTNIFTINTVTSTAFDGTIHGAWPQIRFVQYGGTSATVVMVG